MTEAAQQSPAGDTPADFDVTIVGGGMVGLLFAGLLAEGLANTLTGSALRIAIVEAAPPEPAKEADALDLRVSALSPASCSILRHLGLWSRIPEGRKSPYFAMKVWQAAGKVDASRAISFTAAELGETDLGCIVENKAIRLAAWNYCLACKQVTFLTARMPTALTQAGPNKRLSFADGSEITTRLLVGADGANSWVRQALGIEFHESAYGQAGLVAHISTELPHQQTAWQRFLTNGPVALLPLADGRSSLVWSCPEALAKQLLALPEDEFNVELERALDGVLGKVKCTSKRVSFPLLMGYANAYTGPGYALMGDAAHRVHPLAGQGVNLGMLDAAVLAETLATHLQHPLADPGDRRALRIYERARKGDNLLTMGLMDMLNKAFSSPCGDFTGIGMELLGRSQPIKNMLARYAAGSGRNLPAAAQPLRQ